MPEALGFGNWVQAQEWAAVPGGQATYLGNPVPWGSLPTILVIEFIAIAFVEHQRSMEKDPEKKKYPGGAFDPLGYSKDPAKFQEYKVKEIKNGEHICNSPIWVFLFEFARMFDELSQRNFCRETCFVGLCWLLCAAVGLPGYWAAGKLGDPFGRSVAQQHRRHRHPQISLSLKNSAARVEIPHVYHLLDPRPPVKPIRIISLI